MRAVVIRHEENEGEGWFGPALREHGFTLEPRFRAAAAPDVDADLVVVLGGSMSAAAPDAHPFLHGELAMLEERLRRGAPCLGICLGAQLLARAAGSRVRRGAPGPEIGALPIGWTTAARTDPVIAAGDAAMVVAHWHEDTFDPVPGAVLLASSERYEQQAFRLGDSFAFQFHLELDGATFAQWLGERGDGAAANALQPGEPVRRALVDRLARHFAETVRARRRTHR